METAFALGDTTHQREFGGRPGRHVVLDLPLSTTSVNVEDLGLDREERAMTELDRRSFLKRAGAATAGTLAVGTGVEVLTQRFAAASSSAVTGDRRQSAKHGYGELELRLADQRR